MVLDCAIYDHLPILLDLAFPVTKPAPCSIKLRPFKHFSEADFIDDLWSLPWCIVELFDDVNDEVSVFNTLFQEVLKVHAPIKSVRVKKNPASWISKPLRDDMDKQDRLLKLHRRNPSSLLWAQFNTRRNHVVSLQRQANTSIASFPPRPIPPPCGDHLTKPAEMTKRIPRLPSTLTTILLLMC